MSSAWPSATAGKPTRVMAAMAPSAQPWATRKPARSPALSQSTSVPVKEKKTSSMTERTAVSTDMMTSHGAIGRE